MTRAQRRRLSLAIKKWWRGRTAAQRRLQSQRISRSLKLYHRTGIKVADRRWGKQVVQEERKERRKVKIKLAKASPMEKMKEFLGVTRKFIRYDTDLLDAVHADGSVDVELRIAIPRGVDGRDFLRELAEKIIVPQGMWVTFGWIFSPGQMSDEEIEKYEKIMKLLHVHSHYRRTVQSRIVDAILQSISLYDALEENKRRKPEQFYIRLHWDPTGLSPRHREPSKAR